MKEEKWGVEVAGVCCTYKYLKKTKVRKHRQGKKTVYYRLTLFSYQNDNFFPLAKGHTLSTAGRTSRVFSSQVAST